VKNLKEQTRDDKQFEIGVVGKPKAKPKPKDRKVDAKEQEINALVGPTLVEEERWDNRNYDSNRDNRGGYGNRKKEAKFKFSANDFPEL